MFQTGMKLQIECNQAPFQQQCCLTCNEIYEMVEAKVLVCNNQGKVYGEVCPHCLKKGFHWLSDRFEQLMLSSKKASKVSSKVAPSVKGSINSPSQKIAVRA